MGTKDVKPAVGACAAPPLWNIPGGFVIVATGTQLF